MFSRIALATLALAGAAAGGPVISSVVNNYSYIPAGLPSYGIAPGSLFIIFGTGLSDPGSPVLQSSAAPGLPTTLNHSTISVTVKGVTTTPAIYYTSPTQIAAVLPSTTPTGMGTLTLTYNGVASSPAALQVTASAFGIDQLAQYGSGGIIATDGGGNSILPIASASPGQTITIWGSGLVADTANDDRSFPQKQDNLNNARVYIGGEQAEVTYAGRSQYPGLDQINVVIPWLGATQESANATGFQGGCGVSVVVVADAKASNFGTLPVNPSGGVCIDPETGVTGAEIETITGTGAFESGIVHLSQDTEPMDTTAFTTSYSAVADFESGVPSELATGFSFTSAGSCVVSQGFTLTVRTEAPVDAGTAISLTGGGLSVQLTSGSLGSSPNGFYSANLTTPLLGGTAYTFTGSGGKDGFINVGPFTATITFPIPITWTNESSVTTITESQGVSITWTGGTPGTYITVSGGSTSADSLTYASFFCRASIGDQQFTVPSYVLLSLPKGKGHLAVANAGVPAGFTADGIEFGAVLASVTSGNDVTYQ